MFKASTLIKIPVSSNDDYNFVHRATTDPYHQLTITEKVNNFLENDLKNLGCDIPKDFKLELSEVIYNCYDAYAKRELVVGNELTIRVDIQEEENKVVVNIQDNGSGFTTSNSGGRFTLEDIKADKKGRMSSSGGERTGLVDFRKLLESKHIGLFFSNSQAPDTGAVVTMEFPKQHRAPSPGYEIIF